MQELPLPRRLVVVCIGLLLSAGCAATATGVPVAPALESARAEGSSNVARARRRLTAPALIAVNFNGSLEFWPIDPKGGHGPQTISPPLGVPPASSIASDGDVVAIANASTAEIVLYNVENGATRTLPDPYGTPVDIAIDKSGALYVLNGSLSQGNNVAYYLPATMKPRELVCGPLNLAVAIAIDNEGDIFVHGYGSGSPTGAAVFEIPNGPQGPEPQNCATLALKSEPGYVAGLAVDPKTDDLVAVDNPDLCAGGVEDRMTVYPKPYSADTGVSHDLGPTCPGLLRLDATSTIAFIQAQGGDPALCDLCRLRATFVLQRTYPGGKRLRTYNGGDPGGITTIPSTLLH